MLNQLFKLSLMPLGVMISTLSLAGGPDNMSPPVNVMDTPTSINYSNKFLPPVDGTQFVLAVSGGAAWTSAGETQTFYSQANSLSNNTYAANNNTLALGFGELFVGLQHGLGQYFSGQLGLGVTDSSLDDLSGNIWQYAHPAYNNLSYSYDINQVRVALEGKLILDTRYIQPYISGSAGVGFNHAYDYDVVPTTSGVVAPAGFSSGNTNTFTYTVGAGLQTTFKRHWQTGIGYEFADWGQSTLGTAPGQTVNGGLNLNHLYSNALKVTLGYIF